ncbi:carboxy-S-adenosyl-L-methionine synthase CmoA [Marinobacter lutaoensis]|jgi:tRNA (cmo5U34)-methyltransferase|uniref:Carboxy-S-adenosyl-L-methionine synthase n=1 Tax=Marinobacter lutaoensis TaxID=135739 RepID=A0A1V2DWD9_9GAMM|nr:carboxy-S-adenosyl-L-methionine synthase CmoA [Marinobacter lutaoensis]MBI43304.1 carboxy-S-adenosyl-L-methionine synthase CmoA [Oceanospirillales bacterium]NVD34914.1 carboxy-S-adenosyl-L-methionine synthase CmoA [Marinobacter lutaoensis]ONF44948.1 carboxy-S-adenosyl-L-methionine synthase CmoA [Marinobacter lutaoensis]|tara:strand:+ start:1886 stop:2647 length:762 start_codon:yes stop_codon:yes gene_type:complete
MTDSRKRQPPEQATDRLFATERKPEEFRFDASVARVFPDMIRRSVPGYTTIIPMIEVITEQYAQPGSHCYDLGCSLGASTLAMRHGIPFADCHLFGVDNSPAMIERCEHYIALDDSPVPVTLRCEDILDTELSNASVTTLNFTLQFIAPAQRAGLLQRIAEATRPGGVLILSEKLCFESEQEQEIQTRLHHAFKRANGYSDLEISQKRTALEQVLIPETLAQHQERLRAAGFDQVLLWYQCFNFTSLLAIKTP